MSTRVVGVSTSRSQRGPSRAAAARAMFVAVVCVAVVVAAYAVFVRTEQGQRLDQLAMDHLEDPTQTGSTVSTLLRGVTVGSVAILLGLCVVVAFARRRWALASAAVLLVAGANLTTQLLKEEILTRPFYGFGLGNPNNSLPSGHMTVVASLVLAALLVVPHAARWLVGLGGSLAVAVTGVGTIVANWHRPSDVVAALAVTLAWGAAVLAVLSLRGVDRPFARPTTRTAALVVGLAAAGGLFVALGVRPDGTLHDLVVHLVTMSGLAVAGALTVGLYARMVDARVR